MFYAYIGGYDEIVTFSSSGSGENIGSHTMSQSSKTERSAENALEVRGKIESSIARLVHKREKLTRILDKLPPKDKEIMYLVYVSGFTLTQTAQVLKKKPDTVIKAHRRIVLNLSI